jgi:outer membrane receptor protein involved in Fe transport
MSQDTTPAPSATATPQKKALLDAFDTVLRTAVEERELERRAADARRRNRGISRLLMVVCTTIIVFVLVYLSVERPEWAFPAPTAPESTAVRQASLRITIANAVQHIERYRQQRGTLPSTLEQAGANGAGLIFNTTSDGGYRVLGDGDGVQIVFTSGDSLTRFIGNSFEVISRRTR